MRIERSPLAPLLVLIMVVSALAACGDDNDTPDTATFTDPAAPIAVEVGEQFIVELESNATTGYTWELGTPLDAAVVALVAETYEEPGSTLVGAGGLQQFRFEAVGPGPTQIALRYVRPWEDPPQPDQEATFTVDVTG